MDIKIKVKKLDYDDIDVKVIIDKKEYTPYVPDVESSYHSCGITNIDNVSFSFETNKKIFKQLTPIQNLQLTLLCVAKAISEPIIQGSVVVKTRIAKKKTEIGELIYKLKDIQISAERKNPNSGNTIVAFQFDKLNFIRKNKL